MNINNITNTSGNWTLISNNIPNINTTVNITATPKKTRNNLERKAFNQSASLSF